MGVRYIEPTVLRSMGGTHAHNVTFIDDEDWRRHGGAPCLPALLAGEMPKSPQSEKS
jgi:hypothetical protein